MREDLRHWGCLSPPTNAQIIRAYNTLADKMDEIYDILATTGDDDDANEQIRNRYIDIINNSSRLSADLYTNLANAKRRMADKLEMLATLQRRQQETAAAFEQFAAFHSKGKDVPSTTDRAPRGEPRTTPTANVNANVNANASASARGNDT